MLRRGVSGSPFARVTVNVLAIVVLLFAGSVQAQDSPADRHEDPYVDG